MKELTMQEKAKRYDEALEKAKECHIDGLSLHQPVKDVIEHISPEIKESEDEKIRKILIEAVTQVLQDQYCSNRGVSKEKIVAWLEKQGESDETKAKMFLISKGYPIDANGKFPTYEEMYDIIKEGLEKQGEYDFVEEPNFFDDFRNSDVEVDSNEDGLIAATISSKFADNVEPKFKVGDWVIDKQGIPHQIANVVENVSCNTYGYDIVGGGYFNDNTEGVRLWTIEDAKDGDVLVYKDEISIYKHDIKNCTKTKEDANFGGFVYHCCYDGKRFITDSLYSLTKKDKKDIYPATKEQRDLLLTKMGEADYEFDFEKKELKKIEDKIEIPFGAKDSELQEASYHIPKGFYAEIEGNKVIIKKGKQKPAWSEEDKKMLNQIISIIEAADEDLIRPENTSIYTNWLKSKVQPHKN